MPYLSKAEPTYHWRLHYKEYTGDCCMLWEAISILWIPKCGMTAVYKNLASDALWIYISNKTSVMEEKLK